MKKYFVLSCFVVLFITFSLSACVSDAEYKYIPDEMVETEPALSNQSGDTSASNAPVSEQSNDEPDDNKIAVESGDVVVNNSENIVSQPNQIPNDELQVVLIITDYSTINNQIQSSPYVYSLENLSEQQVCNEIMRILNNPPYQNEHYSVYESLFAVSPIYKNYWGYEDLKYYFYDLECVSEQPKHDCIISVDVDGTCTELDGTIGIENYSYGGMVEVTVNCYIKDYNRAALIYGLLYDCIAPYYSNPSNTTEGSLWYGYGTVKGSEGVIGVSESFVTLSRDSGPEGYSLVANITR